MPVFVESALKEGNNKKWSDIYNTILAPLLANKLKTSLYFYFDVQEVDENGFAGDYTVQDKGVTVDNLIPLELKNSGTLLMPGNRQGYFFKTPVKLQRDPSITGLIFKFTRDVIYFCADDPSEMAYYEEGSGFKIKNWSYRVIEDKNSPRQTLFEIDIEFKEPDDIINDSDGNTPLASSLHMTVRG